MMLPEACEGLVMASPLHSLAWAQLLQAERAEVWVAWSWPPGLEEPKEKLPGLAKRSEGAAHPTPVFTALDLD